MKNDLNSIIIEGTIVSNATLCERENGEQAAVFSLQARRYFSDDESETMRFEIEIYEIKLVPPWFLVGVKIRVVGRVRQYWESIAGTPAPKFAIVADNVVLSAPEAEVQA